MPRHISAIGAALSVIACRRELADPRVELLRSPLRLDRSLIVPVLVFALGACPASRRAASPDASNRDGASLESGAVHPASDAGPASRGGSFAAASFEDSGSDATVTVGATSDAGKTPAVRLLFDFRQPFPVKRHGHRFEDVAVRATRGLPGFSDCNGMIHGSQGSVEGSFTAKGAKETAFLVDGCLYPPEREKTQLVIVNEKGKVVRNQPVPGWLFRGKTDLELDGVEELVVSRGVYDQVHSLQEESFLVNAEQGFARVTGLGVPWWQDCEEQKPDSTVLAAALYVHEVNGKRSVERRSFRAPCANALSKAHQEDVAAGPFGPAVARDAPEPLSAEEVPDVPHAQKLVPTDDALAWRLLYDFRSRWPASTTTEPPPVLAGRLLAKVNRARDDTRFVNGGARGAFRTRGVLETAYVVYVQKEGPRGSHVNRLVLQNDHDELFGPFDVPGDWVLRAVDVDDDGIDELVMVDTNGTFTGFTDWRGFLVSLRQGHVVSDDLGVVDEAGCGQGRVAHEQAAVVFVANDGAAHRFRMQSYTGYCPFVDSEHGPFVEVLP